MKLKYKIMEGQLKNAYLARRELKPCFDNEWHYHEEYELIYFIRSSGVRYIGNMIGNFSDGEIYLAGPNIPHLYKNDNETFHFDDQNAAVDLIIIHFREDFLGKHFLGLPETDRLNKLLKMSGNVLRFSKTTSSLLHNYFIGIPEKDGLSRISDLLVILHILSLSEDYETVWKDGIITFYSKSEKDRMSKVINYLNDNYKKRIDLAEISGIANMTSNSFCKFFKKNTSKSFSDFLNEIRIGNACKLLIEGDQTISAVSVSTGFNSISSFNRTFKHVLSVTPSEYKKKYTKEAEYSLKRI